MRRIVFVIFGLSGSTVIVAHFLIRVNRTIFRNEVSGHKICFDFLYNFETFLILRKKNERDVIKNVFWSFHVKYPLFYFF